MIEIFRQYLEIKSLNELNDVNKPDEKCKIEILEKPDFQLNKFFYKQIGKNHRWIDRLSWTDQNVEKLCRQSKCKNICIKA